MEVSTFTKEDSFFNLCYENLKKQEFNIDDQTFKKYDKNNKHFFIKQILTKENFELIIIGFDCIYQYENKQIQLNYQILNRSWSIISEEEEQEEEEHNKLNNLLKDINYMFNLSFEQQIQLIIKIFDQHFNESKPSTIIEVDEEQIDLKSNHLIPTITFDRIRHDSSCSSNNSIKHTEFVPPSTMSVRRRRVIQSIHINVQRKKKLFENVANQLKHKSTEPTLYQLGLEFLRIYDGKFNYPEGHTFVMSFEKRTWLLTIITIKCVECQLGQPEPRSALILQYKDKHTTVQV